MAVLAIDHIVRTPGTVGGKPRIAGTRVRVQDVAAYHTNGSGVEEICEAFDLTPGQVFAALSYYYDHRDEIDADVQRQIETAARFLAEGHAISGDDLRARIAARRASGSE
jgi:uncharacterized protein (DUF433 family)